MSPRKDMFREAIGDCWELGLLWVYHLSPIRKISCTFP